MTTEFKTEPTGRLNKDCTLMEVRTYVRGRDDLVYAGTHWAPVTAEVRAQLEGPKEVVLSLGASVETVEAVRAECEAQESNDFGLLVRQALGTATPEEDEAFDSLPATAFAPIANADFAAERKAMIKQEDAEFETQAGQAVKGEHSGFDVNYYCIPILHPKREGKEPYVFEVEDLIQALNMGFHEATVLKSLVRSCAERELGLIKQGGDAIRDAEKMVHSSKEHLRALKIRRGV